MPSALLDQIPSPFTVYTSRVPSPASFEIELGDLGINVCKIKTNNIKASFDFLSKKNVTISSSIKTSITGQKSFFVNDRYGNWFQVIESSEVFKSTKAPNGGVYGAIIGVADIDRSLGLYRNVLGYDVIISDKTGVFEDLEGLAKSGETYRRVVLGHSKKRTGGFSELLGASQIELIEKKTSPARKIYENRYWGDLGFIHLCFDVTDMAALKGAAAKEGYEFTVDSANSFDMGEAAGHFTYIADPDGTLIEFVETHKIPIMKKIGWYLDLTKRDADKPLPRWMLSALALNRKKD